MPRNFLVVSLFALAVLALMLGNVVLWAGRTVFNTDQFVSTSSDVLDEPAVRERASEVLAQRLTERADIQATLQTELPPRLGFLSEPLTLATRDAMTRIVLRALDRVLTPEREDAILTALHEQVMDVLKGEGRVQSAGGEVYIDLRPALEQAASDIGLDRQPRLANDAGFRPDAGRIVLSSDSSNFDKVSWIANHYRLVGLICIAIPLALFGLAILAARNHLRATRRAGYAVVFSGLLSLAMLLPLRWLIARIAYDPGAAHSAFSAFTRGFREQSFALAVVGILAVAGTTFWERRSRETADPNASLLTFRAAGYVVTALVLLTWSPSAWRPMLAIILLLVAYVAALPALLRQAGVAGDAGMAQLRQAFLPGAAGSRSSRAAWFRAGGVAVVVVLLVVSPGLTWRGVTLVVACGLLYLAAVDWVEGRTSRSATEGERQRVAQAQHRPGLDQVE